jgi:hypothetical protein
VVRFHKIFWSKICINTSLISKASHSTRSWPNCMPLSSTKPMSLTSIAFFASHLDLQFNNCYLNSRNAARDQTVHQLTVEMVQYQTFHWLSSIHKTQNFSHKKIHYRYHWTHGMRTDSKRHKSVIIWLVAQARVFILIHTGERDCSATGLREHGTNTFQTPQLWNRIIQIGL